MFMYSVLVADRVSHRAGSLLGQAFNLECGAHASVELTLINGNRENRSPSERPSR